MNTIPSISEHIDEKVINKVIQDNFAALAPSYFTLTSNWFVRAYDHYKDIDKFVLIIYLIHQDLIYFRQNGVKINYDTFYKDKPIEINKINISDISKDLGIPKESIRRKVLELEKLKVIKRTGKKIFVVRDTLYSAKAVDTLTEVANILYEFNKILKKEKLVTEVYSVKEIILAIKENEKLFTNPGGNFILQPGQVLIAFGSKEQLNILNGLLGNLVVAVELLK